MRKDLRLGLGIGALALLFVVTFMVVRNHTQSQAEQQSEPELIAAGDGGALPLANNPAGTPGAGVDLPHVILPPLQRVETGVPGGRGTAIPPENNSPDGNPFAKQPTRTPEPPMPTPGQAKQGGANWDSLISEGRREGVSSAALSRAPDSTLMADPVRDGFNRTAPPSARPPASQERVSSSAGRPYTIRQGDTFSSVAKATYGAEKYYLQIEQANPNVNTLKLQPGDQIILPELPASSRSGRTGSTAEPESFDRPINPRYEYRVDTGDSLYRISMKLYGTPRMVDAIYEANRTAIGNDPDRLRLGMVLRVPEEPGGNGK